MPKSNDDICNEDMMWGANPTRTIAEEFEEMMNDPARAHVPEWQRKQMVEYQLSVKREFAEREARREFEKRGGRPKRNYVRREFAPGYQSGKLTLIDRDWQRGAIGRYHDGYWIAKCECGREVRVHNTQLRQNSPRARGCENCAPEVRHGRAPENIAGNTFGRLIPRFNTYKVGWTCDCLECGGECVCRDKLDVILKGYRACKGECTPKPTPNAEQSDIEPSEPSGLTPGQVFGRLAVSEHFPALGWLCLCLTCGGNELCESEEEVRRRGKVECDGACVNA